MDNKDTGLLLNKKNLELQRKFFKQFLDLRGITCIYREPNESFEKFTTYGEIDTYYKQPIEVKCIYEDHPNQKTMRKMGWNTDLLDSSILIHVPYDVPGLQKGALFILPSGLDNSEGRLFEVLRMQNIAVYPASITCELGPRLVNKAEKADVRDFTKSDMNVLISDEDVFGEYE